MNKKRFEDWEEYGNSSMNKEFLKQIKVIEPYDKILEIGCGKGNMTNYLTEQGYDIIGTDVNKDRIDFAIKKYPNTRFMYMDGENIIYDNNKFDVVLSFDVIEHIPNIKKHFQEVNRILKKDGKYIIVTPNKIVNVPYEIYSKKSLTKWKNYHMSVQTKKSLKKLGRETGFNVEIKRIKEYDKYIDNKLIFPLNFIAKEIGVAIHAVATKQKEV